MITLADAKRVLAAAERKAEEIGQPMNIAVVDAGGNLVAHIRMDKAWIGSVDIAINKAWTSRAFDISTKELAELSQSGDQFFGIHASNHGRVMIFAGGIPLKRGDECRGRHRRQRRNGKTGSGGGGSWGGGLLSLHVKSEIGAQSRDVSSSRWCWWMPSTHWCWRGERGMCSESRGSTTKLTWRPFAALARKIQSPLRRESVLGVYGPCVAPASDCTVGDRTCARIRLAPMVGRNEVSRIYANVRA